MGVSGSGKSTLLGLVAGLAAPDSGAVELDGQDLNELDESSRARLRSTRIGVALQSGNLIPFLTAVENVELAIDLGTRSRPDRPKAKRLARELIAGVGLDGRRDHRPGRLSGGELQRVAVAMALASGEALLLADEITAALDPATSEDIMGVVLNSCRERHLAVLYVTHDLQIAAMAEQRLRLADGCVSRS